MASGSDLLKYMTERVVQYMDTPKEERKRMKTMVKAQKEPWLTKWFGMAPMGIIVWWKGRKGHASAKQGEE
ncbi:YqzE family protein [Paenibacillaceae bacterium]|nr:YqzE family protein [Paenibacillaceae bacterium]